jgi:hypothetical protein
MADDERPPEPTYSEIEQMRGSPRALLPEASPGLAVALARAEIDTQISTARAYPRSVGTALNDMIGMATMNPVIAEDCIYAVPRGGKTIRGPSIRFAEIARAAWGNCRDGARVTHVDRLEKFVECEAMFHDLQSNIATTSTVRRKIELKKGRTTIDDDMTQLAGAAGMSIARRNAILGGMPRFVWQQAVDAVEKAIRGDIKTLGERRDRAIAYFAKTGIGIERLLKAVNKPTPEDLDLDDLMTMTGWRTAIQHGDSTLDEIFPEEKKAPAKKDLGEQLDDLAKSSSADPPSAGEGEGQAATQPTPPSEGASSNAPEGAAAPIEPSAAAASDAEKAQIHLHQPAAGKPAGGDKPPAAGAAAPPGKVAAGAPPKAADPARAALAAKGGEMAAKGNDALMEWLDNLSGNDVALITPLMEKLWKEKAEAADAKGRF